MVIASGVGTGLSGTLGAALHPAVGLVCRCGSAFLSPPVLIWGLLPSCLLHWVLCLWGVCEVWVPPPVRGCWCGGLTLRRCGPPLSVASPSPRPPPARPLTFAEVYIRMPSGLCPCGMV